MKNLLQKGAWRTLLLFIYVLLGSYLFYRIERKPEKNKEVSSRLSRELQKSFTTKFNISINDSDFQLFLEKAFEAVRIGNKADWSILTGLSFTMTTLSTVGYGHITPETPLGQIITVLYSFVGLPLTMLTLKTTGEVVSKSVNTFTCIVERRLLRRKSPRAVKIKSFFIIFTLMIVTLCFGGMAEVYLEGWSFTQGFYAWFATLSTIGYGDYVPGWSFLMQAINEESLHSKLGLGLVMSAAALPSAVALSVVSGVINSLVEATEEFKTSFKALHQTFCFETNTRSKIKDVTVDIGGNSSRNHTRPRSATL